MAVERTKFKYADAEEEQRESEARDDARANHLQILALGRALCDPVRIKARKHDQRVEGAIAELGRRDELRQRLGMNGRALAFAGRLSVQKSLEVALEALVSLDGVTLDIAGEGDQRDMLERRARDLGVDTRVRFLGALPRERVLELFRAADAAILSSTWENFPHTVVEALAVGTPVIATDVGGVAEVVHDGENGLLVPAGDAAALADAVRRYFADESLQSALRAAAAASVRANDRDSVFGRIERALAEAAA